MPKLVLPFEWTRVKASPKKLRETDLFKTFPDALKKACKSMPHLNQYIHMLPIDEIGLPLYVDPLDKKYADAKSRNLIYRASDQLSVHVYSVAGEMRDYWIPIEPAFETGLVAKLKRALDKKLVVVEEQLLDYAHEFAEIENEKKKRRALTRTLKQICKIVKKPKPIKPAKKSIFGGSTAARVEVTKAEFIAIEYRILRDKVGMGILEPLIVDKHIEDVSGAGLGAIFLEHKVFKGMRTGIELDSHEELDDFVLRLSESIKRPVTARNPIVDAVLPDGSRINIVFGQEVSPRGSNFTIRKFSEKPLSILELIGFGSISYQMAAYLSMTIGAGMSAFICGETASGKTTLINAITVFVPPEAKVVSIEDTPEVQVPHANWLREVAVPPGKENKGGAPGYIDLLKAALRQRPNLIIIGEIRGEEGLVAFQAMQTGHPVMATFHASSVEKLIQRLTGAPILVPKTYIENLNLVIIQQAVKLPNGKGGRRATSISEIVGYDTASNSFSFVEVFRWNQARDVFEFTGDKNSYVLEELIAPTRGLPPSRKWEIYKEMEKRTKVLEKLHLERGITDYYELLKVLTKAQQEGLF